MADSPEEKTPAMRRQVYVPGDRILRLPQVIERVGLKRSAIYAAMSSTDKDGKDVPPEKRFPRPINLTTHAVGWLEAEINKWLARQIEASRASEAGRQAA